MRRGNVISESIKDDSELIINDLANYQSTYT